MLMLRSVLCPVEFSDQSLHALRWAVALAARNQSRLIVLTAIEPLLAEAARARLGLDLAKADTQPALREFVKAALPEAVAWIPETAFDVRIGDPSEMILEAATREHADLIAVGTHGLGGFRKFLLGSTTERVLRRTSTAVLAVPLVKTQSVVLETDGPRFDLQRILMGTDFSEVSTEALRWATDLAQQLRVPLLLSHVVTPVAVPARWRSYVAEVDEERTREARARLETLIKQLKETVASEAVVSLGRLADSIASIAEERQAGLIVVGLMGQRGAGSPCPGSIAYRVLCLAHVPVLVVPPHADARIAPLGSRRE